MIECDLLFAGIVLPVVPVYIVLTHLLGVQRSGFGFGLVYPVKKLPDCSVIGADVAEHEILQTTTSFFCLHFIELSPKTNHRF